MDRFLSDAGLVLYMLTIGASAYLSRVALRRQMWALGAFLGYETARELILIPFYWTGHLEMYRLIYWPTRWPLVLLMLAATWEIACTS